MQVVQSSSSLAGWINAKKSSMIHSDRSKSWLNVTKLYLRDVEKWRRTDGSDNLQWSQQAVTVGRLSGSILTSWLFDGRSAALSSQVIASSLHCILMRDLARNNLFSFQPSALIFSALRKWSLASSIVAKGGSVKSVVAIFRSNQESSATS